MIHRRVSNSILLSLFLATVGVAVHGDRIVGIDVVMSGWGSEREVYCLMRTAVGRDFSEAVFSDDIKRLFSRGYLCEKVEKVRENEGVRLKLHVRAGIPVDEIVFEGNSSISDDILREGDVNGKKKGKVGVSVEGVERLVGRLVLPSELKEAVADLENIYHEEGFYFAEVSTRVERTAKGNRLVFVVREGPVVKVRRVVFDGASAFSRRRLLKMVETRPHRWYRSSLLVLRRLQDDAERLARFYRSRGFLDVSVRSRVEFPPGRLGEAVVHFEIREGTRYSVRSVTIEGNKAFDTGLLRSLCGLKEGGFFDGEVAGKGLKRIRERYTSSGRVFTAVDMELLPVGDGKAVDVVYTVRESPRYRVGRVDVSGNVKTRDDVIRRELLFRPGEYLDLRKVKKSRSALARKGIFKSVSISYIPDDETQDMVNVNVNVEEMKTGMLLFGVGVSTDGNVGGMVKLSERNFDWRRIPADRSRWAENLFRGGGQNLSLTLSMGDPVTQYRADFYQPWAFGKPVGFGMGGSFQDQAYDEYSDRFRRYYIRMDKRFTPSVRCGLGYSVERVDLYEVDSDLEPVTTYESGKNTLRSMETSFRVDTRDDWFMPTRGVKLSASYELSGEFLGGDFNFWKALFKGEYYLPLFSTGEEEEKRTHVLRLVGRGGWAEALGDTPHVPIYERFFGGGISSVRGYDWRSIGPLVGDTNSGGRIKLEGSVEYVVPLYPGTMAGVIFFDAGNVWEDNDRIEWSELRRGTGFGIRVRMGNIPLQIYYGKALDPIPGKSSSRLHFSMGFNW